MGLTRQTATFLRGHLRRGTWGKKLPGIQMLAAECGVSHDTMRAAVLQLEKEGWIVPGGPGRRREVATDLETVDSREPGKLRVMILPALPMEDEDGRLRDMFLEIRARLEVDGHTCRFAPMSLLDLRHDLGRVKRYVASQPADAWVVAGASKEILEWFASQPVPAMAFGGSSLHVSMPATGWRVDKELLKVYQRLIDLGHRRIVLITTDVVRNSKLAEMMREQLATCGVSMGSYNLPSWVQTPDGLQDLLANTFRVTPPTALIISMANWMPGVHSFLTGAQLSVPEDVSLVCLEENPGLSWCRPPIAHIRSDTHQLMNNIIRWIDGLTRGRDDDRNFRPVKVHLIENGSIGRARE